MKKRLLSLALAALLLLSLLPAASAALTPEVSANRNAQTYHHGDYLYDPVGGYYMMRRWADTVKSALYAESDTLWRVEYLPADGRLIAESYGADGTIRTQRSIDMELPVYGGFFAGADANFVVFGQENPDESDEAEIVRVVKYSKDWQRLGSASLFGENTTVPFDGGSLRMTEGKNLLFVHTCHEMYQSSDGYHHQSNLTFAVRKSDMTVTDVRSAVMNSDYGYVSHSFNQFIALDGNRAVMLDHGDAHPRSAYLYRCPAVNSQGEFLPAFYSDRIGEGVDLMVFQDCDSNYNATGANLGGLVVTPTHYIAAIASVDQSAEGLDLDRAQRNLFICAVPKNDFSESAVQTRQLTSYAADDGALISTPQLVSLPDGRALVLWTLDDTLFYRFLKADGSPDGSTRSAAGALSDCAPTVIDGVVRWYVTDGDVPVFYAIDPATPGTVRTVTAAAPEALEITEHPESMTVTEGGTARFSVAASGDNLSYQWQYSADGGRTWSNSTASSAVKPTLSFTAKAAFSGRYYRCVVTDGTQTVTSEKVRLTVKAAPPVITVQPQDGEAFSSLPAVLSVQALGSNLSYQWQYSADGGKTWKDSSLANRATVKLYGGSTSYNGRLYRCVVTNESGKAISEGARITVTGKGAFPVQPLSQTLHPGDRVVLTAKASHDFDCEEYWQYSTDNGKTWKTSTAQMTKNSRGEWEIAFTAKASFNGRLYRMIIPDANKPTYSEPARLTIRSGVIVTTHPQSAVTVAGNSVSFSAKASGTGLKYQWQYSADGGSTWKASTASSAAKPTLTITAKSAFDGRLYRCVVTDKNGVTDTSREASLTVHTPPAIKTQPKAQTVRSGASVTLSVAAAGSRLCYQWQYSTDGGNTWVNSTAKGAASITFSAKASYSGRLYRCVVSNCRDSVTSRAVTLTVN